MEKTQTGWIAHHRSLSGLMIKTFKFCINEATPDVVLNIESHFLHVTLCADNCEYNLDVGRNLWLNRQRWSRLIREYVPGEALSLFIGQALEIINRSARDGATANMMFRDPVRYAKKHRWGGCLMGLTFQGNGAKAGKPTITVYSRTSYVGYMGFLDAAIIARLAQGIKAQSGYEGDIGFRWHLTSMQIHCFKSLPYMFSVPSLFKLLTDTAAMIRAGKSKSTFTPTLYHMAKWYIKIEDAYEEHGNQMLEYEKYGPFKRIKRRWLEHMGYSTKAPPPSLLIESLDFSKAQ